jgi:preprotein translocase subunit SecA
MKAGLCLGFAAMANSSRNFELVMCSNGPWKHDPQLEKLANKYYTKSTPINLKTRKKVGRNDPCPCGSGKKYKKCHGVF